MKTTEFIAEYNKKQALIKRIDTTKSTNFVPYDYQNELCTNLDNNRFLSIQHSRQMGITSLLSFYVCNFLINNTNKKNVIYVKTGGSDGKHFIEKLRIIINEYLIDVPNINFITNNSSNIKLSNNNEIFLIVGKHIKNFDEDRTYSLVVDNAVYVEDLNELISKFMCKKVKQIILASNKISSYNQFYNTIFINQNSIFSKHNIDWKLNPKFNGQWYDKTKLLYGNENDFNCEINLWDVEPKIEKTNAKNRIINVRLDDELLAKVSKKLINEDVSLSEYIRNLINNDN